jgi:hypothetical protein
LNQIRKHHRTPTRSVIIIFLVLFASDPLAFTCVCVIAGLTLPQTTYLRGVTCDIVEAEEAAFIPEATYNDVLAPLFMMDATSGLFISTVMGPDNPYTELLGRKHPKTGKPLFKKVEMTLVCKRPECQVDPRKCIHRIHRIPPWQSVAKHYVSQTMIGSNHAFSREMAGSVADEGIKVFELGHLMLMFDSFVTDLHSIGIVKFALTSVDPNNDGSSDYAMVSMLFTATLSVVSITFF